MELDYIRLTSLASDKLGSPVELITVLTMFSMLFGVYFFMGEIAPKPSISLGKQPVTFKKRKVLFAQLTTFLFIAGHLTLYAYLTPFLKSAIGLCGTWVRIEA